MAAPKRVVTQAAHQVIDQPFVFSPSLTGDPNPTARRPGARPTDSLVVEARREIAEIVREVAQAVRGDRSAKQFMTFLADRVLRAMAAEGVIVWRREESTDSTRFLPAVGLGRITHESTSSLQAAPHQRLIAELAGDPQPVVVPASPGAIDDDVPANPTQFPAAVVPIQSDPTSANCDYVLQVFLESDCGVATQRGYLRFVAQMADLAGEFLRIDGYRQLQRQRWLAERVDDSIVRLHEAADLKQVESVIVDAMAETFELDRVGLCYLEADRVVLAAVSHVETIDTRSTAADQIRDAARANLDDRSKSIPSGDGETNADEALVVRLVIAPDPNSSMRLVLLNRQNHPTDIDPLDQEIARFVRHAELARRQSNRRAMMPGARYVEALIPKQLSGTRRWAKAILAAGMASLLFCVAVVPLPLVVVASATIRPADVQNVSAPRDVLVEEIHVQHGQVVDEGDILLTLVDSDLQQQIVTLVGKRAVLAQQQSRWTDAIVAAESRFDSDNQQLQSEQRLVDEEIRAIDQQLSLLRRVEESLVVRADRCGVVDAWRLEDRLLHRPLRRGDHVLHVIEKDSPWFVDARVAQKRLSHIEQALEDELTASVALLSRPSQSRPASLVRIGPAVTDAADGQPSTVVVLTMEHDAFDATTTFRDANVQSGTPAQVSFHCGTAPAAYLLFRDLIRTARGRLRLYVGGSDVAQGDQA